MNNQKKSAVIQKYQQAIKDYKKMVFLYWEENVEPIKKDSKAIISDWKSLQKK